MEADPFHLARQRCPVALGGCRATLGCCGWQELAEAEWWLGQWWDRVVVLLGVAWQSLVQHLEPAAWHCLAALELRGDMVMCPWVAEGWAGWAEVPSVGPRPRLCSHQPCLEEAATGGAALGMAGWHLRAAVRCCLQSKM